MKTLFTMDKVMDKLPSENCKNWYWEAKFLLHHLKLQAKVLQIGSCDGIRLDFLAKRRKDLRFIGLEIDKKLSDEAKKRFKKYHGRVRSVNGDARKIPFKSSTFDYAICLNNTLGYIPNNTKVVSEMKRVAVPNGEVIVSVYGRKWSNKVARQYFKVLGVQKIIRAGDRFNIDGMDMKRYRKDDLVRLVGKKVAIIRSVVGFVGIVKK